MALPDIPIDALRSALNEFGGRYRQTEDWASWEFNRSHKFAIERDGKPYPVEIGFEMPCAIWRPDAEAFSAESDHHSNRGSMSAMEKRYQVFVSSTYADLKEERRHVIQTLMEMDCIPAGMEIFPAADEEQLEFIKRIIDDCDYYLLIVGGRYGSVTAEGISYTEKEYDYAVEKGLNVIALLHENPDQIILEKSEIDQQSRANLKAFRKKISSNRLVKCWNKPEDLPGLVATSLSRTIKTSPAVGWVRANTVASQQTLSEINELRKENDALKSRIRTLEQSTKIRNENLAELDEEFKIEGSYIWQGQKKEWNRSLSWRELFACIAPYLLQFPNDAKVKAVLTSALKDRVGGSKSYFKMSDQDFQTVSLQLKALGFIKIEYSPTTKGGMALFWSLTPQGERLMMQLRTVPSNKKDLVPDEASSEAVPKRGAASG